MSCRQDFAISLYNAGRVLEQTGFADMHLADMEMPDIQNHAMPPDMAVVRYATFGEPAAAERVLLTSLPWSTRLDDPSTLVRLKTQSLVLPETTCLVAIEAYAPQPVSRFIHLEKQKIKRGDFEPVAARILAIIEKLGLRDDQALALLGFSFAADAAVETTFQNQTNEAYGIRRIDRLTAIECARARKMGAVPILGAIKTMAHFNASGKDLFDNVIASGSAALREARGIDLKNPRARKKHDGAIAKAVVGYVLEDIAGNVALAEGFAQDTSHRQLHAITSRSDAPVTTVGRASDSRVCPPEFLQGLHPQVRTFTIEGDHSVADNLRNSAAFAIMAADKYLTYRH